MNRRGFLALLGKLAAVGAAIGVAPELLAFPKRATIQILRSETVSVGFFDCLLDEVDISELKVCFGCSREGSNPQAKGRSGPAP